MCKEPNLQVEVLSYYTEDGMDIREVLRQSILLFVESEVKKYCR